MPDRLSATPEQLKLMSFGPRRDIIAALANDPDLSARDLAGHLSRPVTGLYRHLNLLVDAGLIRETGQRPGPKRPEALYSLTAGVYSVDEAIQTQEGRLAVAEMAKRYASTASRRIRRAVETNAARMGVPEANARVRMSDLQLDRAGIIELNRLLDAFIAEARKLRVRKASAEETVSVTILIAPDVPSLPSPGGRTSSRRYTVG